MENASLRESLASVQKELISLLNRRQARRKEEPDVSAVCACLCLSVLVCTYVYSGVVTSNVSPSVEQPFPGRNHA